MLRSRQFRWFGRYNVNGLELLTRQCGTLFVTDGAGRLLAVNEPERPPAPAFFLGRSAQGNLWRCHADLPGQAYEALTLLAAAEPVGPVSKGLPHHAEAFRKVLEPYVKIGQVWSGPAYIFPEPLTMPAGVVRVTHETLPHLGEWIAWLEPCLSEKGPCFAVLEDGRAVALCHSSRTSPEASEAGLETLPAFRGRGYGAALTRAWAYAVRQEGRTPLYSTSWTNLASQGVARSLSLRLYASDYHLA